MIASDERFSREELLHFKGLLEQQQRIARFGIWEWDLQKDGIALSKQALWVFGRKTQGARLSAEEFYALLHPDDRPNAEKALQKAIVCKKNFGFTCRIRCKHGGARPVYMLGRVVCSPEGEPAKILGTVQEITGKANENMAYAEEKTEGPVRFESRILKNAKEFIHTPLPEPDNAIAGALRILCEYCGAARAAIYRYKTEAGMLLCLYQRQEADAHSGQPTLLITPALAEKLQNGQVCHYIQIANKLKDLPDTADITAEGETGVVYPLMKNGSLYCMLAIALNISDLDISTIPVIELFAKITSSVLQRIDAEKTLQEKDDLNALIFNSVSDAVITLDTQGVIININPEAVKRLNKSGPLVGQKITELIPHDQYGSFELKRYEKFLEVLKTGCPVTFEDQREENIFYNRYYPVYKDGRIMAVALFYTDITDRRRAQEEAWRIEQLEMEAEILRRKEEEYLQILNSHSESSWIYDFAEKKLEYSAEWKKRIGAEDIPDNEMERFMQSILHPQDYNRIAKIRMEAIQEKRPRFKANYRIKNAQGDYIWVLDYGKYIYDENLNPRKANGISIDITDYKKTELTVMRQNHILKTINLLYEKAANTETLEELGKACLQIAAQATQSSKSLLGQAGNDGFILFISADDGTENTGSECYQGYWHLEATEGFFREIICGETFISNEPFTQRCMDGKKEIRIEFDTILCTPLQHEGAQTGMIAVGGRPGGYTEEHKEILETLVPIILGMLLRKSAEEKLKESEHLMRAIMDSANDFMFLKDSESRVVMVNRAYGKVFGVKIEDVIGKNDYELYEDREMAKGIIENDQWVMRNGKTHICEETGLTVDGYRTFLMCKTPWRDANGKIIGILGTGHDITERKAAELELKQKNRLLDLSSEAVYVRDTDGMIQYWNYGAERLYGYKKEEALGQISHSLLKTVLIDGDNLPEALQNSGCWNGELMHTCKDGHRIAVDSMQEAISNHLGEKIILETNRDITERKSMEQKLILQAEELKAADQSKNEFIGVLSHELRNPLAVISTALQLIGMTQDEEEKARADKIIKRQMAQLCRLVDELLDLTRITQNKAKLKKEYIRLNKTAEDAAEDIRPEFENKNVRFEVDISKEPIILYADPVRMTQILGNLLFNALKFTQENGAVKLSLQTEGNDAVIIVKDNGKGIRPEILTQLFQPFFQEKNVSNYNNNGLGLGLSIVKGILDLHGGRITAFSEGQGLGSAFTMRLPVLPKRPAARQEKESNLKKIKKKVLIIEDNCDLSDMLCAMLKELGSEVKVTAHGEEGLGLMGGYRPDIVLCDIGLPGISGYEVAKEARKNASLRNILLVALTGYAGSQDFELAINSGFDRHLAKPVNLESLKSILGKH